jgi:penicillin-binding protein 1A
VDGYQPQNANRKYSGWLSLRDALTNSVNVISVKLIMDVGFEPVIQMAHNMGIKSKLIPAYSLALGTSEVNLLELTNAFSTLAAQGVHIEAHGIRRILNRKGQVIYDSDFKVRRVLDKNSASIITWMMEGVVNSGTGQAAQLDRPVAGKTGTSEQARDLWFIGFIPQLAVGVWLGNDDNSPTWSASSTAAAAWHEFMKTATRGMPIQDFPELPRLEGRKGSIKAKPIKSARVQSAQPLSDDREYDNSGSYYRDRDESYSNQDSRNTDSGNSESTGSSPESAPSNPGTESSTPVPVAPPSAPPDLPMPPPINTAPPAPVEPAPAAPPAEPSPVPPSN